MGREKDGQNVGEMEGDRRPRGTERSTGADRRRVRDTDQGRQETDGVERGINRERVAD